MDPPDAPYDNLTNVQRARDLDTAHVMSVGSVIFDEYWRLEGCGRVVGRPSRT